MSVEINKEEKIENAKFEAIISDKRKWNSVSEVAKAIKLLRKIRFKTKLYYLILYELIDRVNVLTKGKYYELESVMDEIFF